MLNLELISVGVGTVLGVLALLWFASAAIGRIFLTAAKVRARRDRVAVAAPDVAEQDAVVVAAAVAAMLDVSHRIVSIAAPLHYAPAWAIEGRHASSAPHRSWDQHLRTRTAGRPRKKPKR
jgi:Na+-transporting methylmalonyl-CoA/oxaloacetate decarboxylase gamma subunit